MRIELTADYGHLQRTHLGIRAPLWWGVVGVVAIELTVFATLVASYFYLRLGQPEWPPPGFSVPDWRYATAITVLLLISSWTIQQATNVAIKEDRPPRLFLFVSVSLAFLANAVRFVELMQIDYLWNENAYTSIFWAINGLHFTHVTATFLGTGLITLIVWNGPLRRLDKLAIQIDGVYWQFVAWVWVPLWILLYFVPRWI